MSGNEHTTNNPQYALQGQAYMSTRENPGHGTSQYVPQGSGYMTTSQNQDIPQYVPKGQGYMSTSEAQNVQTNASAIEQRDTDSSRVASTDFSPASLDDGLYESRRPGYMSSSGNQDSLPASESNDQGPTAGLWLGATTNN